MQQQDQGYQCQQCKGPRCSPAHIMPPAHSATTSIAPIYFGAALSDLSCAGRLLEMDPVAQVFQDEILKGDERAGAKIFDLAFQAEVLDLAIPLLNALTVTGQEELIDGQALFLVGLEVPQSDQSGIGRSHVFFVENL